MDDGALAPCTRCGLPIPVARHRPDTLNADLCDRCRRAARLHNPAVTAADWLADPRFRMALLR
jgi:hypothetical protein